MCAGNVYKIIEHLHVKPGKGSAFVRTKLKNLTSGGNLEKTFRCVLGACMMFDFNHQEKKNLSSPFRCLNWPMRLSIAF